tara:strand:- start:124 stop:366 length:243 start_codon:yes stop_codon:yes gene_type:complete
MTFPNSGIPQDESYRNPDSFAISFDESWRKMNNIETNENLEIEQKIDIVFEEIKDHPLLKYDKEEAYKIAKFRIRLLNLQ